MTPDELLSRARAICDHCCAPFAEVTDEHVAEAMVCFWDVLALAERQQEALVEATAKATFCNKQWNIDSDSDIDEDFWQNDLSEDRKELYRVQAREELSIQKRPMRTEAEKAALRWAMELMGDCDAQDVLRRLIEEE